MLNALGRFVLAAAITSVTLSAHAQPAPAPGGKVVKIGVPLELSGRFVAFGSHCKAGVDMAADAFGGKSGDVNLQWVFRDVQSDAQTTVAAITDLVDQEKVTAMIGPVGSPIVGAAIAPWRRGQPVWLVPGASTVTLEEQIGADKMFFHLFPYAYYYHVSLAAALKQAGAEGMKMAIIASDDDYGTTHLPFALKYFTAAGIQIVDQEIVRTNSIDFNPVLTKVNRLKPDILLALFQTTDAVTMAKQVYTRRLPVSYLVGTASTPLLEWQNAVGEAQEGWLGVTNYISDVLNWPANPDYPDILPSTPAWEAKFRARYNRSPDQNDIMCYSGAAMLAIAIGKAGSDDKEKIAAALREMDMHTPLGQAKFGPTPGGTLQQAFSGMLVLQRQHGKSVVLYPPQVANGKLEKVKY